MVGRVAFAVPGDLTTPTGGYAYDRRIIAELKRLGWQVDIVDLGSGFPHPSAEQQRDARVMLSAVADGCPIVVDGLAFGVLAKAAACLRQQYPLIALVHHPLALESGLDAGEADAFRASETAALACASRIVTTSRATARLLAADYDVPCTRITVARPGSDMAAHSHGSGDGVMQLVSVGAVVARKGYDVLIAALATLTDLPWRLTIAGDRSRDGVAVAQLDSDIARYRLSERVTVLGAVPPEQVETIYAGADLFALASRFEGYGMAFAEAIAHGLPVVATTAGAIPDTVPSGAGILVPPDDVDGLAAALRRLIEHPQQRQAMAAKARAAAKTLPTWAESAALFSQAIEAA